MTNLAEGIPWVVPGLAPIIGHSAALGQAVALARRAARTRLPVFLVAPTGCGKELFAHHIHRWSGRPGEIVDVNCAALPESLMESELFGHAAGSFTGARHVKPGLIEIADGTSCLLDEIPSLSLPLQAKLLRVVETQELRRVGEVAKRRVDVRFLAAAQDDVWDRVATGAFRKDLYHRLAGIVIRIPALVERPGDVLPLARQFAASMGLGLDPAAERVLLEYEWPGNVRELRMVIERSAFLADAQVIPRRAIADAIEIGAAEGQGPRGRAIRARLDQGRAVRGDRVRLTALVADHGGSIARTSRELRLPRATLQRWLREVGL